MEKGVDTLSRQTVDGQVDEYLHLSPDEQVQRWTSREFVSVFPHMVQLMLSQKGLEKYSIEARTQMFMSSVRAIKELPLGEGIGYEGCDGRAHIAARGISFDAEQNRVVGAKKPEDKHIEDLLRIDLAGVVLLGMSMPDDEAAMEKIVEIFQTRNHRDRETLVLVFSRLLPMQSAVHRWVKKHNLDIGTGKEWDSSVAELLLNLPLNAINVQANTPYKIPIELTGADCPKFYSQEAFDVFLDYAVQLAQDLPMSSSRRKSLVDFTLNVRRMPPEFVLQESTQIALKLIHERINSRPEKLNGKDEYGELPDAGNLLPRYEPKHRRFRHYKGVKELLK